MPTHLIGNDAFQEADNVGISRPRTKHNYLVKDGAELGAIVKEAFHIAATGRPGPGARGPAQGHPGQGVAASITRSSVHLRSYNPTYEGHPGQIKKAARALVRAKRPVLYVGGGAISADAVARADGAGRADPGAGHADAHGDGRLPHGPPAVARHARDARHVLREHGRAPLRRAGGGRRALRRPGDGQGGRLRARRRRSSTSTSTPRRSRRTSRSTSRSSGDCKRVLARAGRGGARGAARATPRRVREARRQWAEQVGGVEARPAPPLRLGRRRDQAAVRRRGDLEPHQRRGAHRHRRRPAPDVGGPVLPLHAPAAPGARPAASAPWATGCRARWACRPAIPTAR